jgi:hypothetical protein
VVRRADISPGQIYRWGQELGGAAGFAQVLIAPAGCAASNEMPPCAEPAIEVEVGKARVRIPGSVPAALAAGVKALSRR